MNWIFKNKNLSGKKASYKNSSKNKTISLGKKKKMFFSILFLVAISFSSVLPAPFVYAANNAKVTPPVSAPQSTAPIAAAKAPEASTVNEVGSSGGTLAKYVIGYPLQAVQYVVGMTFSIAATIFATVVDPANVSGDNGILNKDAIFKVWVMVRDVLNMTFILILLFSAFCTIFQVEKWGIKAVWKNILIFALLVNFSYAIARFIIDVSNVAMYYFINNMFSMTGTVNGSGIMSHLSNASKIQNALAPEGFADAPFAYEIAIIIITFIMGITLLIIAVLFVIRLIALAMLIMFAPIGFVGYIFPATSKYADDWWKKLFNYSFFAPIMIFMMAIAYQVMQAIGNENAAAFLKNANANTNAKEAGFIATAAFFSIPIIILWVGMGVAKGMSIAGASAVVDAGQKFAKGAAKKFSMYNWGKKNLDQYKAKRKARQDEIDKKSLGNRLGDKANDISDAARAKLGSTEAAKRIKDRRTAKNKEDIKKANEANAGETASDLNNRIKQDQNNLNKTHEEKIAAAGRVEAAMARGKEYEKEIEKDAEAGYLNTNGPKPQERSHADIEAQANAAVPLPPIGNGSPAEIQARNEAQQKRDREITRLKEENKKAIADYEKAKKEAIENFKTKTFEANRKTIAEAQASNG